MSAGILSQISFGLESTWGTAVTPNKSIAVQPGDGIQTDVDTQFRSAIKAQLAKNVTAFKGAQTHEGEYELDFVPANLGYLLKSAFGSVSSVAKSAPNASVYDHTFTEVEAKPSLTVEQSIGEITRRYAGSIVHTLTFSCARGEVLSLTAGIRAKSSASATKISPAYETIRPLNFADAATVSVGGTGYTGIQSFELTYTNNQNFLHAIGSSNDPQFNHVRGSEVTGTIEFYLDSNTAAEYTDYLNGTEQALVIGFTGDTIGTSSNYGLQLTVPRARYSTGSVPINDDYNALTVEFEGIYDTATSKLITPVLTNLLTNYN
jgi:hypothetical protein